MLRCKNMAIMIVKIRAHMLTEKGSYSFWAIMRYKTLSRCVA